jgi:ATP-dependent helicase/nuclease subunit A
MTPLKPLRAEQADGALPTGSAWMSASAGTGKTQVLTARILRLLLSGAPPERILALTFTKAGAAEMQERLFTRLAEWVAADDAALRSDLDAIRADTGPDTLVLARQLFARTLDARGGLQVQTIHGFAQSLLASFPVEAGIAPGFAALDDRSAAALRGQVLAEVIDAASDDASFIDDIGTMSIASGETRLTQIAATLIAHYPAIAALGAEAGFEPKLRRAFGLPTAGTADEVLGDAIAGLDDTALHALAAVHGRSGNATALTRADVLLGWLGCSPANRVAHFDDLCGVFHTKAGEPLKTLVFGGKKADPADVALAEALCETASEIAALRRALAAVTVAARHLRIGARLGAAYADHKHRAGVIDYDDMIARAAALLTAEVGAAAWVRFKLDARIDHLLVDEAQDTNAAQWDIVGALTDEFFVGAGARDVQRTLFVVGDFKQAIFSFQGSDPTIFRDRRTHFRDLARDAVHEWRDPALTRSFRSVPAVLEVVDAVVDDLGHAAFGMDEAIATHIPHRADMIGRVTLWPPLAPDAGDDVADDDAPWLPPAQVRMAHKLARQIAAWLDPATALDLPARGRAVRPEDILVLVRSRGEFVGALVAALHDLRVPVAGVDRLRLTAPLAVQDCLALVRFALQPDDNLTTAALLTSPFIGLSEDDLFALAHARHGTLWSAVRDADGAATAFLRAVLALADFAAPYEFLEQILSGPLNGRAKLLARLGEEARDQIAALLGQALAFEQANAPSLQGFLSWIADDIDLKRDPDAPVDAVRIMTVHGAKGLQAPVVVLADATRPLPRDDAAHVMLALDSDAPVPVFHGGKAGRLGLVADEAAALAAATRAEHWRLLYVALTRAEDLLFIGGALGVRDSGVAPEGSWHAAIERAMITTWDMPTEDDPAWGAVRIHRAGTLSQPEPSRAALPPAAAVPEWARTPAPVEVRPPRPLSPSAIAADDVAQPPPGPAAAAAARRGQLLHTLFERLPDVPPDERAAVAAAWLARAAADLDAATRERLATTALRIVGDPAFADVFGPDSFAEAPIAATVGDIVIAGTVDRLLVTPTRVRVIDFKTGAAVPATAAEVAPYHLKQMAAYVAALGVIFPGRRIEAALLYTHAARLIALPAEMLAANAPG